ncbi:MAG: RES family NAD+ phosphorylase [Gammaproteobacteria bacterium]
MLADELKTKRLCFRCTQEEYLRNEIKKQGKRARCDYCGGLRRCYSLEEFSERIEQAFEDHYERTSDQPDTYEDMMMRDRESNYVWYREGESTVIAIMNAAEIPEAAAEDIQVVLDDRHSDFDAAAIGDETEFAEDAHYEEKGIHHSEWESEWHSFEESLKTEARFFNQSAAKHLSSLFEGVDKLATRQGGSVVVEAGPGTEWMMLFRARVFQSNSELKTALAHPDRHLGPPPLQFATAGRMNARGISVFYGANSQAAALAEVRPPVGSQVAIACFSITRPLRLLDLTAFDKLVTRGSIFDPRYIRDLEKAGFLRTLGQRLSRPVMPNDEALEYLATQAVADFLATNQTLNLDGLIFPAVQAAGGARNVVLFHKAARVKQRDVPEDTEIEVRLASQDEDGEHREYSVVEETPSPRKPVEKPARSAVSNFANLLSAPAPPAGRRWDDRLQDTLAIVDTEIEIHIVEAVNFKTEKHHVSRHRWEKEENPDF